MKLDLESGYGKAFGEILARVQQALQGAPVRMVVAGGAAMHLYTGERVSEDIDASFSRKIIFDGDMAVSYRDADGRARVLYLDRNYNDSLGLMHEDAHADARRLDVPGINRSRVDVRVLSPLDMAVSKLARFGEQDRADIEKLARLGLIDAASLRRRAGEALGGYVGRVEAVRLSIDVACRLVDNLAPRKAKRKK
jgi:hypothetical protein